MNIDRIARNFSRSSRAYEQQAHIQQTIAGDLMASLPPQQPGSIFDIGCGTGYLTVLLRERFPKACITGIDIADRMIEIARRKLPDVRFECQSFEQAPCGPAYDLVASASTLHWMSDLLPVLDKIRQSVAPGGHVALAVFVDGSLYELRESFARAYHILGIAPNQHTVPFPGQEFLLGRLRELFTLKLQEEKTYTASYRSPQEALRALKRVGGGYSFNPVLPFAVRKRLFRTMFGVYRDSYSDDQGKASLSWKVLFVHGQRVA